MDDKTYIAYGFDTGEKDLRNFCKEHGIEIATRRYGGKDIPLIFLDYSGLPRDDLEGAIGVCRKGVVVVVTQLNQFGAGALSAKAQKRIKDAGAEILVPEKVHQKRGPKMVEVPEDYAVRAQILYDNASNSRQFVIDKIYADTGVKLTRKQLATRFDSDKTKAKK